jgi:leucine zipper transcription factor-like protein 1
MFITSPFIREDNLSTLRVINIFKCLMYLQELERKFSQTAAYANMKKILNKKNEQIKELRGRLQSYEPDENTDE